MGIQRKNKRILLYKSAAITLAVILALFILEIAASLYGFWRFGKFSTADLYSLERGNSFLKSITRKKYSYLDTLYPHPYLGFVHRNFGKYKEINNVGLFNTDFPVRKNPKYFTILLTGGSVAAQFAQTEKGKIKYFEELLNKRYDFGGRTVRVLNGGDGAWKQPQQDILFLLYSNVIDAVITLDGYNEFEAIKAGNALRLEIPANNFYSVNPFAKNSYDMLVGTWLCSKIFRFSSTAPLLSKSHLFWLVSYSIRRLIQNITLKVNQEDMAEQKTSIDTIFSLPTRWSKDERRQFNYELYRQYIKKLQILASGLGIKSISFIQPVPALYKTLTPEEIKHVGKLDYGQAYLEMCRALMALNSRNIKVVSLLKIFEHTKGTIYADDIHFRHEPNEGSFGNGYRIMADAMTSAIGKSWGLKRKK